MSARDVHRRERAALAARLLIVWAAGPLLYGAGLWGVAALDGRPAAEAVCFSPWAPGPWMPLRWAAGAAMAGGAVLMLWVAPWLLGVAAWNRLAGRSATAGAWALAGNCAALVLVCTALRQSVGVDRGGFAAAWLAWNAVLVWLAGGPAAAGVTLAAIASRWKWGAAIGLAVVGTCIALFARQQFGQCFEGDGTEVFELARSLRQHFLPYWEIDSIQKFGSVVVYPAMIDSYWTLAMHLLLGPGEFSTRLVYWIWWLAIFLTAWRMAQETPRDEGGRAAGPPLDWRPAVPLALAVLLICLWYTFYVGYYPYMTDLASPGVPDAMLTLLVLLALWCFRMGDMRGWAVMLAVCTLTSYAGPVMFALTTAAGLLWAPIPRRRMIRAVAEAGLLIAAIGLAYAAWGWANGWLNAWVATLLHESFEGYYLPVRPSASSWQFFGYFVLGSGGLTALGLLLPFLTWAASKGDSPIFVGRKLGQSPGRKLGQSPGRKLGQSPGRKLGQSPGRKLGQSPGRKLGQSPGRKSGQSPGEAAEMPWRRVVATTTIGYLSIILGARCKNLHYLGPLLMMGTILWLRSGGAVGRRGAARRKGRIAIAPAVVSLLTCIALGWPASRGRFTLNEQLGAVTTFQTDSYEEAVEMAKMIYPLRREGLISWELGPHNWVLYAERAAGPRGRRPLVVSLGPPPTADYRLLLDDPKHGKLYCRDAAVARWLASQNPPIGRDRVPRALIDAAIVPTAPE